MLVASADSLVCSRKGVGEQVSEKITPDSTKSTGDKARENVSGLADKAAGAVQGGEQ